LLLDEYQKQQRTIEAQTARIAELEKRAARMAGPSGDWNRRVRSPTQAVERGTPRGPHPAQSIRATVAVPNDPFYSGRI
jgi:hypothetical protein